MTRETIKKIKYLTQKCELLYKKEIHKIFSWCHFLWQYYNLKKIKYFLKKRNHDCELIAIILIEHFGDIIACEPISRYIKKKYPDSYLIWFVRKPYFELVNSNPNIDKTLIINCITELIFLSKTKIFDKQFIPHFNSYKCPICKIPLNKSFGNKTIGFRNYYKLGNLLSVFSRSAGLPPLDETPKVYISKKNIKLVDDLSLPKKFITTHCSSAYPARNWATTKWIQLVKMIISELNLFIVEIGLSPQIKLYESSKYLDFCGKLSFLETAEVIKRSIFFIGIDSGPAHLANAVNTFGIILLGHFADFDHFYMPYSGNFKNKKNAEIIYEDSTTSEISVEKVFKTLKLKLKNNN